MKTRHCQHCGMPIPRRAKICPECGTSQKHSVPPTSAAPRFAQEQPGQAGRAHRGQQAANQKGCCCLIAFIVLFIAAGVIILTVTDKIERARSRHREKSTDVQHGTTVRPEIKIPEMSMPEISIPDIKLPEPPAAEFAVDSYTVGTNLFGETVLYVNVNYTNKAETPECFLTCFQISVQQDDEMCIMTAGNPAQENHLMDQVQPDETALISEAFIISAEKEAAVSVNAFFSDDTYLEQTILPHADGTVSVIQ